MKARPVTVTGVPAARLALDEVTFGVHVVVVVPPAMAPFREAKWKTRPEYEG